MPYEIFSDRYDIKLNWAATESLSFQAKYHIDNWPWEFSDAFRTNSATGGEGDENPAWGLRLDKVFGSNTFLEVAYSGYDGIDIHESRTGSLEDPSSITRRLAAARNVTAADSISRGAGTTAKMPST